MHLSNSVMNTTLTAQLAEAEAAMADYLRHRQDWQAKTALLNQQSAAADAAETSAKGFKEQARALLRQVMGKNTKELQALRAEERAAYSQAEDFRDFLQELELARDEAEISMLEAGNSYIGKRATALATLAEGRMEEALNQLEPLLAAIAMQEDVLNREGRFAEWKQRGHEFAIDAITTKLSLQIKQRMSSFKLDTSQEPVMQALPWQDGLQEAAHFNHFAANKRRIEMAKRKEELDA